MYIIVNTLHKGDKNDDDYGDDHQQQGMSHPGFSQLFINTLLSASRNLFLHQF
jgi:hypothetical protein